MKKQIAKILVLTFCVVVSDSCKKEDLSNLSDNFYVRRNGADIPAYVYGNGSEKVFLIWLHGGPGVGSLPDRTVSAFKELEKHCAVVYFDQRGQGMSQGHYSKADYSIWEMAKDVKALALILKHKYGQDSRLFLMGASWGGALGTVALIDKGTQDIFKGWIEVDGAHDSPARNQGTIDLIKLIGNEQIKLGNSVDYWTNAILRMDNYDITKNDDCSLLNNEAYNAISVLQQDKIVNQDESPTSDVYKYMWLVDNPITTSINGSISSSAIMEINNYSCCFSVTDSLSLIKIPTLLIWGKYDFVVSPTVGQTTYDKISSTDKKLVILDKSGHNTVSEQPIEFVDEVVAFIDEYK